MKIFIFGDSHSEIYHDHVNNTCKLSPTSITMHRISRDGVESVVKTSITEKDVLLIVLGEVDVRCHIYRQIYENKRDEDEIINTLATKFIFR